MSQEKMLKVYLNDWMVNASIVGFINIVGKKNVKIHENYIEFSEELLENFSQKYFDYFIHTYQNTLSWQKIVQFETKLNVWLDSDFETFFEQDLEKLNKYIKDVIKRYLSSKSYTAAYPLIHSNLDIITELQKVKTVGRISKKNTFEMQQVVIRQEAKEMVIRLQKLINYCKSEEGRKYLAAKNVIYTVIKNGWQDVSFLNRQSKILDMYEDLQQYFVDPVLSYEEADKSKYKYECCLCYQPIKDLKNVLTFMNKMGFDVNKKNSHAWNFQNDLAICPICKLILTCLPAGFSYVYGQGIFVNANSSVKELFDVNYTIKADIHLLNQENHQVMNTYRSLVQTLAAKNKKTLIMEFDDVQIVRYQEETYRFNLLSKMILETIYQSERQLEIISKAAFKENKESFSIYQVVIDKLLNSENLFLLIYKLLRYKNIGQKDLYYHENHIMALIQINQEFLRRLGVMEKIGKEDLLKIRTEGWHFKKDYSNPDKVKGICYKLLNALKLDNRDEFMNIILNCYSYLNKKVPSFFLEVFSDDETFKTIGYSFVTGVIGKENTYENSGGKKNE